MLDLTKLRQCDEIIANQSFAMKDGETNRRASLVKLGDKFWVASASTEHKRGFFDIARKGKSRRFHMCAEFARLFDDAARAS